MPPLVLIAHFDKPLGQHMLKEAADKFFRGQCAALECSHAARSVEVGDFFAIKTHNAAVVDRHPKDIRARYLRAATPFPTIPDPFLADI